MQFGMSSCFLRFYVLNYVFAALGIGRGAAGVFSRTADFIPIGFFERELT
jgi:hypothetical protein